MNRTPEAYAAAFEAERVNEYPVMDALEERYGYKIDRELLERMARVLACPVKKNPPNWQHGRLIYALVRHRMAQDANMQTVLDLGTAKGFSSLCAAWVLHDGRAVAGQVWSFDVIDPKSAEPRNSILDGQCPEGLVNYVEQFLPPLETHVIYAQIGDPVHRGFVASNSPISFAFIDGSHTYDGVKADIELVVPRQKKGDIILFDDVQLDPVFKAIDDHLPCDHELNGYALEQIDLSPTRSYAIATRVDP